MFCHSVLGSLRNVLHDWAYSSIIVVRLSLNISLFLNYHSPQSSLVTPLFVYSLKPIWHRFIIVHFSNFFSILNQLLKSTEKVEMLEGSPSSVNENRLTSNLTETHISIHKS
jgi:hypothetical protein